MPTYLDDRINIFIKKKVSRVESYRINGGGRRFIVQRVLLKCSFASPALRFIILCSLTIKFYYFDLFYYKLICYVLISGNMIAYNFLVLTFVTYCKAKPAPSDNLHLGLYLKIFFLFKSFECFIYDIKVF